MTNPALEVELGDLVKDKITGFTGVVVAITHWLQQCDRVIVQPRDLDKDGRIKSSEGFDVPQVEIIEKKVVTIEKQQVDYVNKGGGPRPNVSRGV